MLFNRKKRPEGYTDQELLSLYRESGDLEYLGEVYQRYGELISAICLKYFRDVQQSEDAAMEIFEILVNDLKKHEVNNLKSWLFSVTRNYCLKQFRKEKKEREVVREIKIHQEGVVEKGEFLDQDDKIGLEYSLEAVQKALDTLSEEQQTCVKLFYLEEKRYQQVADETGFSLKQVKSYIQNGKRNLKNELIKQGVSR